MNLTLLLALLCASPVAAQDTITRASSATAANVGPTTPDRVLPGEPPRRKNYIVPALQIPLFQLTLNGFNRLTTQEGEYDSTLNTGWARLRRGPWVIDQDDFAVNQLGHPYQGSMYHGFARASGLNFWEGLLYSNVGSVLWETYGETTSPSINDQVASGTAGPLIGESLFRMANLVLEGDDGKPGFWRELGAAFVSPPTALNRLIFGDRYAPILKSRGAPTVFQVRAGPGVNTRLRAPGSASTLSRGLATADFSMAYGLPGRPGYLYLRPFDYFTFELNALRQDRAVFANIMTRGLLFGSKYELSDAYQGVWGLYGTYDYISPQVFRFSTTAASLGSTFQWRPRRVLTLQGSALGGLGYGTAGTIVPRGDERDFHYGATPQGLLALRLILGTRAMFDTTARAYYLSGTGAQRAHGTERIARLNASFAVRVYRQQAVSVYYLLTNRHARYSGTMLPERRQIVETVGVAFNLLGGSGFGAVDPERD